MKGDTENMNTSEVVVQIGNLHTSPSETTTSDTQKPIGVMEQWDIVVFATAICNSPKAGTIDIEIQVQYLKFW
jgi:hypothetical protein